MNTARGPSRKAGPGAGRAVGQAQESRSVIDDLDALRQEFEGLQHRFAAGQRATVLHTGADGTGAVRVTIDGDGRVASIDLDRSWRDAVGYGLGAAVLDALTDAGMRQVTAWGEAITNEEPEGPATPELRHTPAGGRAAGRPPASHTDGAEARRTLHDMLSLLESLESELDRLERHIEQKTQRQVTGRSPNNMVTVTMAGPGQVVNIDVHRRFLDQAHDRRITQELLGAFEAAYEQTGAGNLDALLGADRLAELYRLGSDPTALLRRLGFDSR